MESKRRARGRISLVLLILWNSAAALSAQNLDCTNDYEEFMFCDFEAQNCAAYNLTVRSNNRDELYSGVWDCNFQQCDDVGQCCCSLKMTFVLGESYNATVQRGGETTQSKTISTKESIKPKTPTIVSVKEYNGNFQVKWKTNVVEALSRTLKAFMTHHKKGDTRNVSREVTLTTFNGENSYDILGDTLAPSTTYVVSMKSFTAFSHKYSDSSGEVEFTTPVSPGTLLTAIIASLSVAAIIVTGAMYVCYIKLKNKWWDTVAKCPNPKLLIMHQTEQEVLKTLPPFISPVWVEPVIPDDSNSWSKGSLTDTESPQQSSGVCTGSSCLSYANTEPAEIIACVQDALTKAFANISPVSALTTNPLAGFNKDGGSFPSHYNPCDDVRAEGTSSGSCGFDNKTYSILLPGGPHQVLMDGGEVQEMLCDSAYNSGVGDGVTRVDLQAPASPLGPLPPVASSTLLTAMSYQPCNVDPGGFSREEDSSLTSVSSGGGGAIASCDPASRVEATRESFDEAVRGVTDENPCYGGVPAGSRCLPPVDDGYQPFQNVVEEPAALFSGGRSGESEEGPNKHSEESFAKMSQSFLSPVFMNQVRAPETFPPPSGYQPVMEIC